MQLGKLCRRGSSQDAVSPNFAVVLDQCADDRPGLYQIVKLARLDIHRGTCR